MEFLTWDEFALMGATAIFMLAAVLLVGMIVRNRYGQSQDRKDREDRMDVTHAQEDVDSDARITAYGHHNTDISHTLDGTEKIDPEPEKPEPDAWRT